MSKDELMNNLGSIAKSGTKEFLDKFKSESSTQIGQFGVGFYSSFLVADKVVVTSKANNDTQHVWVSTTEDQSSFAVSEDPRGNTLGRGTLITLHLKEDADEYLNPDFLKSLVTKYSEFINFPIYVWSNKTITKEIPVEVEEEIEIDDEDPVPKERKYSASFCFLNPFSHLWNNWRSCVGLGKD